MPSNHLILCHPLLLLPSIVPSIRVFWNESVFHIKWPKYWSFSFSISPSKEYSGLISFRMDWSSPTPQFKSINSSVLSFHYRPTLTSIHDYCKKTQYSLDGLCRKVMSLLLSMLSKMVITFHPRSKSLLISWPQSPSTVILEPPKKVCHCFHRFPIYLPWSDRTGCHNLSLWMLSLKPIFSVSSFTFIKRLFSS